MPELIAEVVGIFKPLAHEKGIEVKTQIENDLPFLVADESRVRQVLHNLLANAVGHTHRAGTVTLSVQHDGNHLSIDVLDSGDGIDRQHPPHLFDRFYRADKSRSRDRGGTGLGLATANTIIESHGGQIHAYSEGIGHGSRFSIRLPISPPG